MSIFDFPLFFIYIVDMGTTAKKTYNFPVVIEKDENGYFAFVPQIQGCYSQGGTYEEVMKNVREALDACLLDITENSKEISFGKSIVSLANLEVAV